MHENRRYVKSEEAATRRPQIAPISSVPLLNEPGRHASLLLAPSTERE